MKIAVIGSSHTVSLKTGWNSLKGELADQIDPTFFGVGANFVPNFGLDEDGVWRPLPKLGTADVLDLARKQSQYINGATEIDLKPFDAVCMAGFEGGIEMTFRLIPQIHIGLKAAEARADSQKILVSFETFEGLQADILANALNKWPLANIVEKPVFLMPPPLLFEKFLNKDVGGLIGQRVKKEIRHNPEFPNLLAAYRACMVEAFLMRHGVHVLPQQAETIADSGVLSSDEFGHGAERLNGDPQSNTDFGHGNADYGAVFWRSFARRIQTM